MGLPEDTGDLTNTAKLRLLSLFGYFENIFLLFPKKVP